LLPCRFNTFQAYPQLSAGSTLDSHMGHGHTFATDDSLYASYGQVDGLAAAMRTTDPVAAHATGPLLPRGQKLVGWAGYHTVKANSNIPHYLPH
jgi:hypothetical protein